MPSLHGQPKPGVELCSQKEEIGTYRIIKQINHSLQVPAPLIDYAEQTIFRRLKLSKMNVCLGDKGFNEITFTNEGA